MGIDRTGLEAIFMSQGYINKNKQTNMLTLGRQSIHINNDIINDIANKNMVKIKNNYGNTFCEIFFAELGFTTVDSIDNSDYEHATIIHDLNKPIPSILKNKYNYIFDGGTIEHIFNTPQLCENVIDMLDIGGIFLSVTCNNNYSGHGIYQFSPEFFMSAFSEKYGMKVIDIFLGQVDTLSNEWINVNTFNHENGGRNVTRFMNTNEVYIITIAQKITNQRESLIHNSPQQYSYENISWKK
jgi:hypothetical protein